MERILSDIIDSAQMNKAVTQREAQYAIVALGALLAATQKDLHTALMTMSLVPPHTRLDQNYKYVMDAMAQPPGKWLGPNNDPKSPEFQAKLDAEKNRLKMGAKRIFRAN